MNYSWSKISDLVKIDNLIKRAQRDIRTYTSRKTAAEVKNENSAEDVSKQHVEIDEAQADFDELTAKLETLTAGSTTWNDTMYKLKKADTRLFGLKLDNETAGEDSLLSKEYGQGKTEALLAVAIDFEAGGQARKTQVQNGG